MHITLPFYSAEYTIVAALARPCDIAHSGGGTSASGATRLFNGE
jgi:hypothetical protein